MKIAFINGSFAPGKDGVGDFAAALAARCVTFGHTCTLIGLNDRHTTAAEETARIEESHALPHLRLPATMRWEERIGRAIAFRDRLQPDWISLQFVAYAYQNKGIVAGLLPRLRRLIGTRDLHMMMHELWSGGGPDSTPKERLVGSVQRFFVLRMLKALRPAVLHTTLPVHLDLLRGGGIHADLLPLFGAIPFADLRDSAPLIAQIRGTAVAGAPTPLIGGFFGAFYAEWQPEPLFSILQKVAAQLGRPLRLITAGRLSPYGAELWENLTRSYPQIHFVKLGEQPAPALSQYFQSLDFAIAAAPWHLLGKSSAAAALLDHGVPLIVSPAARFGFCGELATSGDRRLVHRCDETLEARLLAGLPKATPRSSIAEVSETFLSALRRRSGNAESPHLAIETTDKTASPR
jgi:hypothetical protein